MANDAPYVTSIIPLLMSAAAEIRLLNPDQRPLLKQSQKRNDMLSLKVRNQLILKTQMASQY